MAGKTRCIGWLYKSVRNQPPGLGVDHLKFRHQKSVLLFDAWKTVAFCVAHSILDSSHTSQCRPDVAQKDQQGSAVLPPGRSTKSLCLRLEQKWFWATGCTLAKLLIHVAVCLGYLHSLLCEQANCSSEHLPPP